MDELRTLLSAQDYYGYQNDKKQQQVQQVQQLVSFYGIYSQAVTKDNFQHAVAALLCFLAMRI